MYKFGSEEVIVTVLLEVVISSFGDVFRVSEVVDLLLLRTLNSGILDSGLLVHPSEVTAGSLNRVHSTVRESRDILVCFIVPTLSRS
jgi:hypothetical protein